MEDRDGDNGDLADYLDVADFGDQYLELPGDVLLSHGKGDIIGNGRRLGSSGSNSVVESQPSKLLVAGSNPVSRSIFFNILPLFSLYDAENLSACSGRC